MSEFWPQQIARAFQLPSAVPNSPLKLCTAFNNKLAKFVTMVTGLYLSGSEIRLALIPSLYR